MKCKILSIILIAFFLVNCAGTKKIQETKIDLSSFSNKEKNPFYLQNVNSFTEKTLSNGISVVLKKMSNTEMFELEIVFENDFNKEKNIDGLDSLTLKLMMSETETYTAKEIKALEYTDSAYILQKCTRDFSEYGFICPKTKVLNTLKVFADTVLNPKISSADFTRLCIEEENNLLTENVKPTVILLNALYENAYENNQYKAKPFITSKTIADATLRSIRFNYGNVLNANKIKIYVAGDFTENTENEIFENLEKLFGKIPQYKTDDLLFQESKILEKENIFCKLNDTEKNSYALGYFSSPSLKDEDYLAYAISSLVLDDVLFREIREKRKLVDSLGTGIITAKNSIGIISLYKIYTVKNLSKEIYNALLLFPNEDELNTRLDYYKNLYISRIMASSNSTNATINQMILGEKYLGNYKDYIERPAKIHSLTAKEIISAYNKYIKDSKINWIIASSDNSALNNF